MFAIVSQAQRDQWDEYQRGVNAVKFLQDKEGRWYCPLEMVDVLPEVFVDGYETVPFVVIPSEDAPSE